MTRRESSDEKIVGYGRTVEDAWALARRLYQRLASQEKYNIQSRRSLCELSDRYKAERDAAKVEVDSLIESLSFATAMTRQSCAAGKHPDWWLADEQPYKCPWCDCERFRAEIDDLKALARRLHERNGETIGDFARLLEGRCGDR